MKRRDGRRLAAVILITGLAMIAPALRPGMVTAGAATSAPAHARATPPAGPRPSPGGYFQLAPVGAFPRLPDDRQAAEMVHRSSWEPRPQNREANTTRAPLTFHQLGYGGETHREQVFGRITGNFTGTTDEIIQWAAAKWGLPDNVVRAEAVVETDWFQNAKSPTGSPVQDHGYGDFGDCGGSPPGAGYGRRGPSSFGLLQAKWCSLAETDRRARSAIDGPRTLAIASPATDPQYGGWPWTERSTAYAVDTYAAVIRGCYEGWDTWLGGSYRAGDLWGCVGRWYSGEWHTPNAERYIAKVRAQLTAMPWQRW